MRVRDIMTENVQACHPDTDLAAVAKLMWDHDCGFVPVVDSTGALAGVVTDRDVCMATATRGLAPGRISANQAMGSPVRACMANDTLSSALGVMKEFKVRRLPVIDSHGALVGVLALNDLVLAAERTKRLAAREIVAALAGICEHRSITPAAA